MKCMRGESDRAGERQCGERGALGLAGCGDVGKVRTRRERLSEGVIELSIVSPEFHVVSPEFHDGPVSYLHPNLLSIWGDASVPVCSIFVRSKQVALVSCH